MSTNIKDLFSNANQAGHSAAATSILVNNLNATTIAGAQGVTVDDLTGDEVTLFVEVIDRTGSMGGYRDDVIRAYNEQLQALLDSKAADSILMSSWLFNTSSTLRHGFLPLTDVPKLDQNSYSPNGSTALYDAIIDAFTSVVAYGQSLRDAGVRTKVVIVVITDGEDNASNNTAAKVATVAKDMLNQEIYTLAFVAFGVSGKAIAKQIGFPDNNVMDETSNATAIRRALNTISKSVIRASQTIIGQGSSQSFFS